MTEPEMKFSDHAFTKMILHILKHLKSDCYGVLIGKVTSKDNLNNGVSSINNSSPEIIEVIDTYALSHDKVFIPQLDLFLRMTESNLAGSEYYILGFYENLISNFDKVEIKPSLSSHFMCDGLTSSKKLKRPYLLEVSHHIEDCSKDNKRIQDILEFNVFKYNSGNFENILQYRDSEENPVNKIIKALVAKHVQTEVSDFDDHLLEPKLDFTNSFVNEYVEGIKKK
eukprot:CAMPEP_0170519884 /NCGR_PEP_ID=MMETSP0209-20121228/5131_1 /TAXON_ID=665100 ORGANISM="Litonotus pictus, Strain P1" /NCGR_SAMPLE_ID=MMETSP0209 /ASSEMBLY_ACC=CAM_ASM_000301 /LENGTH=225 /DNA_ID=CAMNT_0010805871 /DNA_START=12 /DNA_END=689 /DNA_ORIENTATION=+